MFGISHKNKPEYERHFRTMRFIAALGMCIVLSACVATLILAYSSIRVPIEEAHALMHDRSLASPHTIQFDRLDKVVAGWRRKQAVATSTLPAIRDPFSPGNAPASSPEKVAEKKK